MANRGKFTIAGNIYLSGHFKIAKFLLALKFPSVLITHNFREYGLATFQLVFALFGT